MPIIEELRCFGCNKKLGDGKTGNRQKLWDTAWRGVYWCGGEKCAVKILKANGRRFKLNDSTNYE